jgi:hypothetical protein
MHLVCKQCSIRLSNELQPILASERNEEYGADFLPDGKVIQEDGTWFRERSGDYVVNLRDVVNVRLTNDSKRLNGCCGLDGLDGPNLQCENCGIYVATKQTDCWQPHCIVFDPATTAQVLE